MGDASPSGSPYPPRQEGHVDNLTAAQRTALGELCKGLPAALDGLDPEHLTLWGVPLVDLARPTKESQEERPSGPAPAPTRAQSVVLLKFLRARQFDVAAALEMLVKCLKWRRDFDVAGLSLESFPQQLGAAGQLSGRDRAGNPVTYNFYGRDVDLESVFGSPGGVATFVRWRVRLMEQAVALLDFEGGTEHVTQVHDYGNASMFRMDAQIKQASREIIKLFQDNYPEMLSVKLFLNVPRIMEFLFGLFSAFSDAATRAKFIMAAPSRARAVLLQYIDPAQAPGRFGGFLETCSVPPKSGRPASFIVTASKHVTLKPGESHVTSRLVGPDSEVVWGFCSAGTELQVSIGFRPRDNGEAAAAAAESPDHVAGTPAPNSPHRDAQHITESHNMVLVKEAASGRLVLGCAGEVVMCLENSRGAGFFTAGQTLTVHYLLLASGGAASARIGTGTGSVPLSEASLTEGGGVGSGRLNVDSVGDARQGRVFSYKSFGCSSLTSNDVGLGELTADGGASMDASSPSGRGALMQQHLGGAAVPAAPAGGAGAGGAATPGGGAVGGVVSSGRIETVEEADESGAVSPTRGTATEVKEAH